MKTPTQELQSRIMEAVLCPGIGSPLAESLAGGLSDAYLDNFLLDTAHLARSRGSEKRDMMRRFIRHAILEGMEGARTTLRAENAR